MQLKSVVQEATVDCKGEISCKHKIQIKYIFKAAYLKPSALVDEQNTIFFSIFVFMLPLLGSVRKLWWRS